MTMPSDVVGRHPRRVDAAPSGPPKDSGDPLILSRAPVASTELAQRFVDQLVAEEPSVQPEVDAVWALTGLRSPDTWAAAGNSSSPQRSVGRLVLAAYAARRRLGSASDCATGTSTEVPEAPNRTIAQAMSPGNGPLTHLTIVPGERGDVPGESEGGNGVRSRAGLRLRITEATRDQAVVTSGQLGTGLGNLLFALIAARLLLPGHFAQLASFLALYTLLGMPGAGISAAAAVSPSSAARIRPFVLRGGVVIGIAIAFGSPWVGPLLRLPISMVVVLGLSMPSLAGVALERGRLYASRGHGQLVASLLVEPAIRLTIGVLLATAAGAVGGAVGVAIAGYGGARNCASPTNRVVRSGLMPQGPRLSRILGRLAAQVDRRSDGRLSRSCSSPSSRTRTS